VIVLAAAAAAEPRTLISADTAHGGYGGPSATVTTVEGAPALMVGGRGAWLVDHHFSLGGAVNGLLPSDELRLGYGGVWVEYAIAPASLVHAALGALGGFAWVGRDGALAVVPAVEPMASVEANVTSFLRVALGASWRQLGGAERVGLAARELSGPAATLAVRFGKF
jgi:hypothetical protein